MEIGEFIVADPNICHGKPTFRGSRIMVRQVVEQVALGMPWEQIVGSWRGKVSADAIREAVALAARSVNFAGISPTSADSRRKLLRS